MKKGLTLLLSTYFLISAPSVIQAQGLGLDNPVKSLNLLSKSQSIVSSVQQEVLSTVSEVISQVPVLSEEPNDEVIEEDNEDAVAPETQVSDSTLKNPTDTISLPKSTNEVNDDQQPLVEDKGLLNIDLGLNDIGNVSLDVISENANKSESGEMPASKGSLLVLEINDSELLGDVKAGLLSSGTDPQNGGQVNSGSLAAIDLENLLGEVHIGVVEGNTGVSTDTINTTGGLLLTDLNGSLLGDIHLGLAEVNAPEQQGFNSGLISLDINNSILGDTHIGIIGNQQTFPDGGNTGSDVTIIIDLEISPIGEIHIGVGEDGIVDNNHSPPSPIGLKDTSNSAENNNPAEDPNKADSSPETDESDIPADSKNEKDEPLVNRSPNNVEQLIDSTTDEIMTVDQNIDTYTWFNKRPAVKTVVNKNDENASNESINILNTVNEKSSGLPNSETVAAPSASSGSTGSSTFSGGSGIAAYLNLADQNDSSLTGQMMSNYKDLSNQWMEAPPIGPPKKSFFLSYK